MAKNSRFNRYENYNIDKIDAQIAVALIADSDTIYVPKRIAKAARQLLKIRQLSDKIKVKTI